MSLLQCSWMMEHVLLWIIIIISSACLYPSGAKHCDQEECWRQALRGWLSYGGCLLLMFKFKDLPVTDFMIIYTESHRDIFLECIYPLNLARGHSLSYLCALNNNNNNHPHSCDNSMTFLS